ncbi:MEDS domain-containing protein [Actinoplanes sp. NPDC049802]|uniref:MEDS domain-containing protein n=1 Tax=Actinoplanes sp. NPDC049802 TaxID=3154742 RepID=UPI003408342A
MVAIDSLDRLRLGDHACVLFDDDAEKTRALFTFVRAGLRDSHRILYFGADEPRIAAAFPGAIAAGRLRMATPEQSYLASGVFDPQATIAGWRTEAQQARADGFRGLRAAGDMSWAARPVPGADRLQWYEAQVNRVFADGFAMAVCLYDRRLFTGTDLDRICRSHPATIDHDSHPATAPLLRAVRTGDPPGLALHGEADLSNRQALSALLENLADDTPGHSGPLTVDMSGLRFADAAAIRLLTRTAARTPRLRLVGASPAIRRLLTLTTTDQTPEPTA